MGTTLDPNRKGEIAFALLKVMMGKRPITLNQSDLKRAIGEQVEALKKQGFQATKEEISSILEELVREAVETAFSEPEKK
ncbi:MAG: hypothetical protein NT165_01070 [Candidatus Falkowbacteria bacterium]|nr:hypothetical protein [Candidatus Falkowbacteria bacterium]